VTVYLVGAGPGDPGLMTARALELIGAADVIVYDRLIPVSALDGARADAELIYAGKEGGGESMPQAEISRLLVARGSSGACVVRLKGGDPFVFGRGGEEMLACLRAGVPVTVVPGVTSAVGVPSAAGVPVAHRGVAQDFHVISVHVPPGDDRSSVDWESVGRGTGTLVLLMAVNRIGVVAEALIRAGRSATTPVSVIADGTMPTQRTMYATLENVERRVADERVRPPAVVVVGEVVTIAAELRALARDLSSAPSA
jgi:uroporphyrin-III C-methyltransferase/precorrin-2 dehydrogenase/sirohydrochlorin ferrochelatase